MTTGDIGETGASIVRAVRDLLSTFSRPAGSTGTPAESPTLSQLITEPTSMAMYQSLALLAATIRWAARETGRDEQDILDELSKNYSDG